MFLKHAFDGFCARQRPYIDAGLLWCSRLDRFLYQVLNASQRSGQIGTDSLEISYSAHE